VEKKTTASHSGGAHPLFFAVFVVAGLIQATAVRAGATDSVKTVQKCGKPERVVTVYMVDTKNVIRREVALKARMVAGIMFESIGIRLCWFLGEPSGRKLVDDAIVLELVANEPASEHPGAAGFAFPYEGTHVRIFYDRIGSCVDCGGHILLAHVMSHEITHILEGTSHHSQTGLMKAHWDENDLKHMKFEPLPFASEDVTLINFGLKERANRSVLKNEILANRQTCDQRPASKSDSRRTEDRD
jgi:hypothetical protein